MHNGFYDDDLEFQCPPGDDRSRHTGIAVFWQWSAVSVDKENRVVVWNELDMTSAFYVFRLEPAWYKFQAMAKPVSGQFASRWVPNLYGVEVIMRTLEQIHRKLCFLPKPMEAALDPSREVRRDGLVPRSGRPHVTSVLSNTISRRLMLQKNDSLCVAKEYGTFPLSRMVQWRSGKSCEVFSVCSPRTCIVPPEVSQASHSANEVLFQGNVTCTCDPEYIIGAFATLTTEFTRLCLFDVSFSRIDVVQTERFRAQCACVFLSCHVQQARIWKY